MKRIIIISIILLLSLSCKNKIKLISEITNVLNDKKLCKLKNNNVTFKLLKSDSNLILLNSNGEIFKFNIDKNIFDDLYKINTKIDSKTFNQNNKIIFNQSGTNIYMIFDLNEYKMIKTIKNIKIDNFIGINKEYIIFLREKELIFYNFKKNKIKKRFNINREIFYNMKYKNNKILFLSNKKFYIFNEKNNDLKIIKLKNIASSGFLLEGDYIYYGSEKRELIKFKYKKNKIKWKLKLSKILTVEPKKIGKYIIVTPEDNNIYFFNKNGNLYWWEKFDSIKLKPAVIMKQNVCIFLMPVYSPNLIFYDFKNKKTITYTINHIIKSNPIYLNNFIYILVENEKDKEKSILKIGNKYSVDIKITPEFLKPLGKSIKFDLQPINLIEPGLEINILNKSKNNVFEKLIKKREALSFIWIPDKAGNYDMIVKVNSKNQNKFEVEQNFNVVDLDKILKKYLFKLQKECKLDLINNAINKE